MLMPPSTEFVDLCQSQIALLTKGLGSALSIVYLTEELTEVANAKLVPVAAYPEAVSHWEEDQILTLLAQGRSWGTQPQPLLIPGSSTADLVSQSTLSACPVEPDPEQQPLQAAETALLRQQQMIMPLIHEEMVMGLLVTARADRAWSESEQQQIRQVADTLAIACLLDQRAQWIAQDVRQQRLLREQRQDILDDLLHQFRNPLTALRTFGKLLLKRLRPGDNNRTVAEGIVRESDRLKELLEQFDAAIDLDDVEFRRLLSAIDSEEAWAEAEQWVNSIRGNSVEADGFPFPMSSPAAMVPHPPVPPALPPSPNFWLGSATQSPHALTEVLEPLLESARVIAQDRQLQLQSDIPPGLPPVQIDLRTLREVINNLIDNALKYTPNGGSVFVAVRSAVRSGRSQHQAIVVADTGPGIPTQDQAHLFERHYRGVQADTEIPGTGLGLAIARDLVLQMQGEIEVFSPACRSELVPSWMADSEHPGTAVVVWLPETDRPSAQEE